MKSRLLSFWFVLQCMCAAPTALAAQPVQCTQYGIIQVVGTTPTQVTLQVIVFGPTNERRTFVLPASTSHPAYKPGQRICIDPPPTQ
ncbi:MAG: hypothetical protein HKM02_08220 [Pseudomonadales bacterium]|nr:hypothetical protein [Pseudomonadales bacterium]